MRRPLKPRFDILPPAQQELWPEFQAAASFGFTLYGGTAIALRLGHRASVDFDFFSAESVDDERIRAAFPFMRSATVLQAQPNTLSVLVPWGKSEVDNVKVSFFGAIRFGRVGEPEITEDGVLQVAALEDLLATKVKVLLQRIEAKDYRDIAALLNSGVDLATGLAAARELFGPAFQPSESLKAMVYFAGGDLNTLTGDEKATLVRAAGAVRDLPRVPIVSHRLTAQ